MCSSDLGFTTTGATILDDIESLSHGLLFWRSLTQWIGGLGIVFFTIAVLPIFGGVLLICSRGAENRLTRRDGYCIVTFTWFLFTLFGMLPFYFSGGIPSVTDAFLDRMSVV